MHNLLEFYNTRNLQCNKKIAAQKNQLNSIFYSRLFLFVISLSVFLFFFKSFPFLSFGIIPFIVVVFLFLLHIELKISRKINFLKNLIKVNDVEIELLNNKFEQFYEGKEFIDKQHDFVADLDIFGKKSIFQILNRTSTYTGRVKLAGWLINPFQNKSEILQRQEAVQELSEKPEWCLNFMALGIEKNENSDDREIINEWLGETNKFSVGPMNVISVLFPFVTIAVFVLYIFNLLPSGVFTLLFLVNLFITAFNLKIINPIHDTLSRKFYSIDKYVSLIASVESEKFNSIILNTLSSNFYSEVSSSSSILQLKKSVNKLDFRLNILVAALLNGFLLWDINVVKMIEKWRTKHKDDFIKWIDIIGEFDAFISLGLFTYNHPNYSFPEVVEDQFLIQAENIGHPLINHNNLITNNYVIQGLPKVDLLTGANMAGKSTFLRTIGVNLVISMVGAPVCASKFRFTPIKLFTSLRTNDSLQENESFFYAELKRLQILIQHYQNNIKMFFLLDEILKGTNSKDQHKGSESLIKKIIKLNGVGIVATHDVELSQLQNEFPNQIENLCFEITIDSDKLNFDYKLKPGVCKTMNASFLMKKMEIID